MLQIIIQGINGRMGKALYSIINNRTDCEVVAGIDVAVANAPCKVYSSLNDVKENADVIIDFSCPAASLATLEACCTLKMPIVLCTTGFSTQQEVIIAQCAEKTAVFKSANMSVGVNLIADLVAKAATVLGFEYDVEIVEKHHNKKIDAPSGTALMLANAVNSAQDCAYNYEYDRHSKREPRKKSEIGIHSVRGGNIVGDHDVIFAGENEIITISHSASSREVFANGAISAAFFMNKKDAGFYTMKDLIK